jgi:hypothetical protein
VEIETRRISSGDLVAVCEVIGRAFAECPGDGARRPRKGPAGDEGRCASCQVRPNLQLWPRRRTGGLRCRSAERGALAALPTVRQGEGPVSAGDDPDDGD